MSLRLLPDGNAQLLWQGPDGMASAWILGDQDQFLGFVNYGPVPVQWSVRSFSFR